MKPIVKSENGYLNTIFMLQLFIYVTTLNIYVTTQYLCTSQIYYSSKQGVKIKRLNGQGIDSKFKHI